MSFPRFDTEYTGTGDLFAALLLAWLHQHPDDLKVKVNSFVLVIGISITVQIGLAF